MHGEGHPAFPHFLPSGQPDLYLFFKNAVHEELDYSGARATDFTVYGFAVEHRTLAPKLLVVYRSDLEIEQLSQGARGAIDRSAHTDRVELSAAGVARAVTSAKFPTWGPTSKLVMMLALTQGVRDEKHRGELIRDVREKVRLAASISQGDDSSHI
jgi:hypothetical protein